MRTLIITIPLLVLTTACNEEATIDSSDIYGAWKSECTDIRDAQTWAEYATANINLTSDITNTALVPEGEKKSSYSGDAMIELSFYSSDACDTPTSATMIEGIYKDSGMESGTRNISVIVETENETISAKFDVTVTENEMTATTITPQEWGVIYLEREQ